MTPVTNASLPPISTASSLPKDADVLVVGLADASGGPVLVGAGEDLDKAWAKRTAGSLLASALQVGASTKVGSTVTLPGTPAVVVTGLGGVDVTPEQVRRAAGSGVRAAAACAGERGLTVAVSFDAVEPEVVRGVAEGALLGAYTYVKAGADAAKEPIAALVVISHAKDAAAQVEQAAVVAKAVARTRDWVNTPANLLYPETFADEARSVARAAKLDIEVLDERRRWPGAASAASSRWAAAPCVPRGWSASATTRAGRRRTWRWWARASPSTPAGSTSSPPTG